MITGADLYLYWQRKTNKAYLRFMSTSVANRLFEDSLFRAIEKKLDQPVDQQIYDEISSLIKTNRVYTPVSNFIGLGPAIIQSVGNSGGLSPTITIRTKTPHYMQPGSIATVLNLTGYTYASGNINGNWTVVTAPDDITFTYVATGAQISGGGYTNLYGGYTYAIASNIINYYHLLSVKAKFLEPITKPGLLTAVSITGVSTAAQMVVTAPDHNRRKGEKVVISGVTGTAPLTTNINAEVEIIAVLNKNSFIVNASGVGGSYTSGGTISSAHYNYCVDYKQDQKIQTIGQPSYIYPRIEQGEKALKFYADELSTRVCTEATVNYISLPDVIVDMADAVTDLSLYWTSKTLYYICDVAVQNFAAMIKDQQLLQNQTVALIDNK